MTDVYTRLAQYLDELPAGYPSTDEGVEIEILKELFTEQEAELACYLTLLNEEARVVAYRARWDITEVVQTLEDMDRKGLISSSHPKDQPPRYGISQYVVGFHEGQVNRLSKAYVDLFSKYVPDLFEKGPWTKLPQIRTIPINQAIPVTTEVMAYESAEGILRSKKHIAVRNCVCRQELKVAGSGCDRPMESCLTFDESAQNDVATGKGRMITLEEALEKLEAAQRAGMVLQPANSKNPILLCTCCSCCCGVLRNIKHHPEPASLVANNFAARYDPQHCVYCGACVDICPMGAIELQDEAHGAKISLKGARCIGCGLCVGVCPSQAVVMVRKDQGQRPDIPKNTLATYIRMAKARGKWSYLQMGGMVIGSFLTRLIAPRKR